MYYVKHKDDFGVCIALFTQEESAVCFLRYCLQRGETAYITKTLQ
jgi:DNA-binding phage protein